MIKISTWTHIDYNCKLSDLLCVLDIAKINCIRKKIVYSSISFQPIFPNVAVVKLLLECGASVLVRNEARSTPLHVAAIPYNFSSELVEALLEGGAHIDQPNKFGDLPADLVAKNRDSRVKVLEHISLACLAARAVLASGRPVPPNSLPHTLVDFLDLHRP